MYFRTYGHQKTWLHKCLKGLIVEAPSTCNMVNGLKNFSKLKDNSFTIFIDRCEGNSGWKSPSEWYAKSYSCLLTHWPTMASIIFLIEAINCNIFRCNYLRKEEKWLPLFFHFLNLLSILNTLKKKMILIADVFLNLGTPENVVR